MSKLKVQHVDTRHPRGTLFIGHDGSTTHFHPHSRVILHEYATQDWVKNYIAEELDVDLNQLITKSEAYDTFPAIHISHVEPVDHAIHLNDFWICTDPDAKATHVCTGIERDDDGVVTKYHWRKFVPSPDLDDEVAELKEDVVVLQGELDSLLTVDEKGVWNTGGSAPYPGEITIMPVRLTDPEITVFIHNEDKDGKTHTFADAQVGSWIELVEDDEDYCLGKIIEIADTTGKEYFQAKVEVSVGKGEAKYQSDFKVRIFEASGDVDLSTLMPKSGGAFTGNVTWNGCDIVSQPVYPDHLFTSIYSNRPRDANNTVQSGQPFGVKVEIGSGNTYRNRFIVASGSTDLLTVQGGGTGKVEIAREAHYTTSPKTSYADKEIPHWKGVKDWTTGQFQPKGSYATATEKLTNGHERFYNYVSPKSLGDQQFSLSSSNATSAAYVYLYRLYDYYNRVVQVKDFLRTADTMLEIWEQSTGNMIVRFGIKEYGTSSYSNGDVYMTLHRIWGKPSYYFDTSKLYCISLSHMIRK